MRLRVFVRLNEMLGSLMTEFTADEALYDAVFAVMNAFKTHLDNRPALCEDQQEQEFEELEKSIYMLCDWEDLSKK
jgi:hypothetical protein